MKHANDHGFLAENDYHIHDSDDDANDSDDDDSKNEDDDDYDDDEAKIALTTTTSKKRKADAIEEKNMIVGGIGASFSILDPPIAAKVVNGIVLVNDPPVFTSLFYKGKRCLSDTSYLNICFQKERPPLNIRHWPLAATIRELTANAYDAIIEKSYLDWNGMIPLVKVKNAADRIAAYAYFDGALAFSVAINVTRVIKNPQALEDDFSAAHPKYVELKKTNKTFDKKVPVLYKVALLVRSFSVLPIDAWVNNFSSKTDPDISEFLKKSLIGGFGMGLKDSVLFAKFHGFEDIEIFVSEPRNSDKVANYYRGVLVEERDPRSHINTLAVKFKFMSRPTNSCEKIPEEIAKLTKKPPKKFSGVTGSRDLPLTIISIGTIAETEEGAREKARELVDAMAIHPILGPSSYFDSSNFDSIWEKEKQRLRAFMASLDGSESKSSIGKKAEKKAGFFVDPGAPSDVNVTMLSVDANDCLNAYSLEETFRVDIKVVSEPRGSVRVSLFPGFWLLTYEGKNMGKSLTSDGSYFIDFRMQLPASFKRTLQRDRIVDPMHRQMHALMGSAIIGACQLERSEAGENFPKHLLGLSFEDILIELQGRFPFNNALMRLVIDNLANDQPAQNINVASLKEFGEPAKVYINQFLAFQPVIGEDIDELIELAQALWREMGKHREAIQGLSADVPTIKDLNILPPRKMSHNFKWCFPCPSSQLKTKIRDFLVQIAFTSEEYHPKIPILRRYLEEKRDADISCSQSVVFYNCDVDPALLSEGEYFYEKITLDEVEKQYYFSTSAGKNIVKAGEACNAVTASHKVLFYVMSSQWKISEVNRIISLCAEGNKMYENILRKQLKSVQESEESTKSQNDSSDGLFGDTTTDTTSHDNEDSDDFEDDTPSSDKAESPSASSGTTTASSSPCSTTSLLPLVSSTPKKIMRKPATSRRETTRKVKEVVVEEEEEDRGIYSLSEEDCHRLAAQASEVQRVYELKVFSTASNANREDFDDAHVQEIIQLIDQTFGDGKDGLWTEDGKPLGYSDEDGKWNPFFNFILEMLFEGKLTALCTLAWHVDKGYWILENLCVSEKSQGYGPVFMNLLVDWLKKTQQPLNFWVDISKDNLHCCRMFAKLNLDGHKFARLSKEKRLELSWEEEVNTDIFTCFVYPEEFLKLHRRKG